VTQAALAERLKFFHIAFAGYHLGRRLGDPCKENHRKHLQLAIEQLEEQVEQVYDDEKEGAKKAQAWLDMLRGR
jgi:hypothetical protein